MYVCSFKIEKENPPVEVVPSVLINQSNNICDCEFSGVLTKNLFFYSMEVKNTKILQKRRC